MADIPQLHLHTEVENGSQTTRPDPPNLRAFSRRRQLKGLQKKIKDVEHQHDILHELLFLSQTSHGTDLVCVPGGLDKPFVPATGNLCDPLLHARFCHLWERVLMKGSGEAQRSFRRRLRGVDLYCRIEVIFKLATLRRRLRVLDYQASFISSQIEDTGMEPEASDSDAVMVPA